MQSPDNSVLVSIIVPVYNVEKYVEKCLDSLINQTYKNIEILIINDGSTDKSIERIINYSSDERIHIFHKENGGLASARNYGVLKAKGDYIWHVDSDDYAEPNCLEQMVEIINTTFVDIVVTGYLIEDDSFNLIQTKLPKIKGILSGIDSLENMLKRIVGGEVWTKLYKKELYTKNNISQDERYSVAEDIMLNYKLFNVTKTIYFSDIISIHHLHRRGSYSDSSKTRNFRIKHHTGILSMHNYGISNKKIEIALNDYISYDFIEILRLRDKETLKMLDIYSLKKINYYLTNLKYTNSNSVFIKVLLYLFSRKILSFGVSGILYLYIVLRFK